MEANKMTYESMSAIYGNLLEAFTVLVNDGKVYLLLLPVYTILILGERLADQFLTRRKWDNRDAAANIAITLVYLGLDVAVGAILPLAALALLSEHFSLFTLNTSPWGWLMAFLLYDLAWYLDHRIAHRTGLFWAMHHVHHSSEEYNMTVASRGFLLDATRLSRPMFYLLPIFGLSPLHFVVIVIFTNIWGIFQHTRLVGKSDVLDWILASPSNHRVHHGSNEKYIDRNYGECLMIWDHLFGTYQREQEEPTYGVTDPINTYNPVSIEIAGLKWLAVKIGAANNWRDKLACLYKAPEWQPHPPSTRAIVNSADKPKTIQSKIQSTST
jgi:sterol desaturase/sphingolipid hydroxylase (fatty acid hydroxylase superfamily)